MKKVIVSGVIVLSFVLYALLNNKPMDVINNSQNSSTSTPTVTTEQTTTQASSQYKDGTYTGAAADAFYGNIQVRATVTGGKLTNVEFLQYPNDQHESREINDRAMPILSQEAIQAQSANVDIVSRATDSSKAFIESLTSALQQAQS